MAQTVRVYPSHETASASSTSRSVLFVPRDQAYYWSPEWQRGEAEADGEIGRGETRRFGNVCEALGWLDGEDR